MRSVANASVTRFCTKDDVRALLRWRVDDGQMGGLADR